VNQAADWLDNAGQLPVGPKSTFSGHMGWGIQAGKMLEAGSQLTAGLDPPPGGLCFMKCLREGRLR